MNLYNAIENRISERKYDQRSLPAEQVRWINERLKSLQPLYPEIKTRMELVTEKGSAQSLMTGILGGYGKIDAPCCIAFVSEEKEGYKENAGFLMEQTVLELTDQGLGTCWVGGSFSMEKAKKIVGLKENEIIPVLIALGYPRDNLYNPMLRKVMGCTKRKSRNEVAYYQSWGQDISAFLQANPKLGKALDMSIRYPSAGNQQPVRVIFKDRRAIIATRTNEGKYKDAAKMDAGIFIAHFYLSCLEEGLKAEWKHDKVEEKEILLPEDFSYVMTIRYE